MKKIFLFFILYSINSLANNYNNVFSTNNFNITSLMNAVLQDDVKATEVFLKSGANVNESNLAKVSPLHIAAKNNSFNSMKVLIDYKANIDAIDFEEWTPLMKACLNKNKESVKILVENGADIWKKNIFGETALVHSVMSNCIECLNIIKNNYKNQGSYDKDLIVDEINKSLVMTYKKENKDMEAILNIFYDDVLDRNLTEEEIKEREKKQKELEKEIKRKQEELEKQRKQREKEMKKKLKELEKDGVNIKDYEKERLIINDQDVKNEMEYIIKKIYIFQGEVRYL